MNFGLYKTVKIKKFEASGKKDQVIYKRKKLRFVIRDPYFKLGVEGKRRM